MNVHFKSFFPLFYRLPSHPIDKSQFKIDTSKASNPVLMKETIEKNVEGKEVQPSASIPRIAPTNPLEKLKRIDSSLRHRSTERMVDLDTSTVSYIAPSDSMRSKVKITSITPEIVTEKRAKYLSDHTRALSSSAGDNAHVEPAETWPNIKTIGEVNHNNVTYSRTNPTDDLVVKSISSVDGKIDIDEITEKAVSANQTSTERMPDEHETQLQKNSSRINDNVQQDNSLSSFQQGSTNHHSALGNSKPRPESNSNGIAIIRNQNVSTTNEPSHMSTKKVVPLSSTESVKNEDKVEKTTTERDFTSTIADWETTTDDLDDTTLFDRTTMADDVNIIKANTNYAINTERKPYNQPTTVIPTDEVEPNTTYMSTVKVNNAHINTVQRETTQSQSVEDEEGTTKPIPFVPMTTTLSGRSVGTTIRPTKPMVTKTTENTLNEIDRSNEQEHLNVSPEKSTITTPQRNANQQSVTTPVQPAKPTKSNEVVRTTQKYENQQRLIPTSMKSDIPSTMETVTTMRPTTPQTNEHSSEVGSIYHDNEETTDVNAMIAISVSIVAVVTLVLLVGFLFVMRKRQKQLTYGQRCRPVGLDAYSLDNISVYNSVRRKSAMRASKRAFGNAGFDDPALKNNLLNITQLGAFSQKRVLINDEFRDIPLVTARIDEVPPGCEDKNR